MGNNDNGFTFADNVHVVSIQSAKGGVGKSLMGLLLGKIYNERSNKDEPEYTFIIDLDITGTSFNSMLAGKDDTGWIGSFRLQKIVGNSKDEDCGLKDEDNKDVNLLDLFIKYLHGCDIEKMLDLDKISQSSITALTNKDHEIIPSLYLPSGKSVVKSPHKLSVMNDPMHAQWFCDFLLELISTVATHFYDKANKAKCHFILDNPPGWSEFLPLLEKRLIQYGTDKLNILYVSSPDEMDMFENLVRIVNLYCRYIEIYCTKKLFLLIDNGKFDYGEYQAYSEKKGGGVDLDYLIELSLYSENLGTDSLTDETWIAQIRHAKFDFCQFIDDDYLADLDMLSDNQDFQAFIKKDAEGDVFNKDVSFIGIAVNKVFNYRVDETALEQYISKNLDAAFDAYISQDNKRFKGLNDIIKNHLLGKIRIFKIPFDLDMAVIYQDCFLYGE